jgi:hypothetical protein
MWDKRQHSTIHLEGSDGEWLVFGQGGHGMKVTTSRTATQRKVGRMSDTSIRKTFQRLGLQHLNQTPFKGDATFFRRFERCTVLRDANVTYAAHTGV